MTTIDQATPSAIRASDSVLGASTRLWFGVTILGQWAFVYYVLAFYGPATWKGDFAAWDRNSFLVKGYVAGDRFGNLMFATHVLLAAAITLSGAIQLVPRIRAKAPALHRWNGRLYLTLAAVMALGGLHMVWTRGAAGNLNGALANTLNAALMLTFALLAWRTALARRTDAHRRWAMRAFLVVNGVWFFRVGLFAWIIANRGQVHGFDKPWAFGCYLVPLVIFELYELARSKGGAVARLVMAGGLSLAALVTAGGSLALYIAFWGPLLR